MSVPRSQPMEINGYKVLSLIGLGSQASVFQVEAIESKQIYAMKQYNIISATAENFKHEFSNLSAMKTCPHVCAVYEQFSYSVKKDWGEDQFWCLIVAYYAHGDLQKRIQKSKETKSLTGRGYKADEAQILRWVTDLVEGIRQIHEKKLIHRDITPTNILLDEHDNVKIGGFGISTQRERTDSLIGTPGYAAPEMYSGGMYDKSVDIFGLGSVLLDLLTLSTAADRIIVPLEDRIRSIPNNYSDKWESMVRAVLQNPPHERPTAPELGNRLLAFDGGGGPGREDEDRTRKESVKGAKHRFISRPTIVSLRVIYADQRSDDRLENKKSPDDRRDDPATLYEPMYPILSPPDQRRDDFVDKRRDLPNFLPRPLGEEPRILQEGHVTLRSQTYNFNASLPTQSFLPGDRKFIFILLDEICHLADFFFKLRQHPDPRKVLQKGLSDYEYFMTSGNSRATLSIEGQWIWRTHLLHPQDYETKCMKFYGQVIYPTQDLCLTKGLEFADRNFLSLRKEFASPILHQSSPASRDFSGGEGLLRKAEKQVKFTERLLDRRDIYQVEYYLERITCSFVNFFSQVKQHRQAFRPSLDVDFVWHTYMLFPEKYAAETKKFFGGLLDHITEEEAIKQLAVDEAQVPNMCRVHLFHKDFEKLGFVATKVMYTAQIERSFYLNMKNQQLVIHINLILEYVGDEKAQSFCDQVLAFLQSGIMQRDQSFKGEGKMYYIEFSQFLEKWKKAGFGYFSPELGGYFAMNDLFQRLNLQLSQRTSYKLVYYPTPRIVFADAKPANYNNMVDCRCCSPEFYTEGLTPEEQRRLCQEVEEVEDDDDDDHHGHYGVSDTSMELYL